MDYFSDDVCACLRQLCREQLEVPYHKIDAIYPTDLGPVRRPYCHNASLIVFAIGFVQDTDVHYKVLQLLLKLFPECVNKKHLLGKVRYGPTFSHATPLHIAAACNNVHAAKLLLQYGADLHETDGVVGSAEKIAIECKSIDVLK